MGINNDDTLPKAYFLFNKKIRHTFSRHKSKSCFYFKANTQWLASIMLLCNIFCFYRMLPHHNSLLPFEEKNTNAQSDSKDINLSFEPKVKAHPSTKFPFSFESRMIFHSEPKQNFKDIQHRWSLSEACRREEQIWGLHACPPQGAGWRGWVGPWPGLELRAVWSPSLTVGLRAPFLIKLSHLCSFQWWKDQLNFSLGPICLNCSFGSLWRLILVSGPLLFKRGVVFQPDSLPFLPLTSELIVLLNYLVCLGWAARISSVGGLEPVRGICSKWPKLLRISCGQTLQLSSKLHWRA